MKHLFDLALGQNFTRLPLLLGILFVGLSCDKLVNMDFQLRALAEERYGRQEFVDVLFELALENQWFELQHLIQHDMAKAILADYSCRLGHGYLDDKIYYAHWEEVIEIGWRIFLVRTGISKDRITTSLEQLRNGI